ncbi:signal peptidase I [Halobellus rufus]|uniref:signal peptidase I n=1 Tax=Halobellus rufus TaxID=1448860 RepID=UPI000678DB71|nr:signal peptidase I [Halobellus rufus]
MGLRDRDSLRTAANVVGVLVLLAVVVPFVVYGFPQVVGADHGFVVLSGSMEPAMSPGDAIIVREADRGEIEEREIITYRTDSETPTTHRVVDVIERDGGVAYQTKGDANEDPDPGSIPHEQVLGEVLFVIPFLGYVVRFANTTVGFVALVVAPLALFTLSELRALLRSVRDGTDSNAAASAAGTDRADSAETSSAATSDGGDAAPSTAASAAEGAGSEDDAESNGSITLTRSSLQLLGLVFALYLPYSAYVAYTMRAAWSITAAIATGIALLFVTGLYAGSSGSKTADSGVDEDASEGTETPSPIAPKRGIEADGGERIDDGESEDDPDSGAQSRADDERGEKDDTGADDDSEPEDADTEVDDVGEPGRETVASDTVEPPEGRIERPKPTREIRISTPTSPRSVRSGTAAKGGRPMREPQSDSPSGRRLSRRGVLYGVVAAGAAATSGSGVAAFLTDEERVSASFTSGTLDLDVDVLRPTAWQDGPYTASIGVNETETAEFELSVDSNPAYVWLLTPCPTCEPIEPNLDVRVELDRPEGDPSVLFDGTLGSFRDEFATGGLLSPEALPAEESWTVTVSWTPRTPVDDDVAFDFEFRAVQARNLDAPAEFGFDRSECEGCQSDSPTECGEDISFVAFCGEDPIDEADVEFETRECGDSGRTATMDVTEIPDHVDEVLLKYATNLDVFAYDGESTPFSVTTGGHSDDLSLVATYDQQDGEYPESGDPPRRNSDPCPGKHWLKWEADGGVETGQPGNPGGGNQ